MKLKTYLIRNKIARSDFARAIGVTEASVSRYITASRIPRPRILSKIHKVTKGAVSPNDFLRRAA